MKSPSRWAILLVVFFIGFLVPELNGYFRGIYTLSQANWAWSDAWWPLGLVVSFAVGLLLGHLFWGRRILVLSEHPAVELFADAKDIKAFEEASQHSQALALRAQEASREVKRRAF